MAITHGRGVGISNHPYIHWMECCWDNGQRVVLQRIKRSQGSVLFWFEMNKRCAQSMLNEHKGWVGKEISDGDNWNRKLENKIKERIPFMVFLSELFISAQKAEIEWRWKQTTSWTYVHSLKPLSVKGLYMQCSSPEENQGMES